MDVCCKMMEQQLQNPCKTHKSKWDCPDVLVHRTKDGEFGLIVHDGGSSYIGIKFCPWCGKDIRTKLQKVGLEPLNLENADGSSTPT